MSETSREGLDLLLDLDDEVFYLESGYWTKFEVKKLVAPTPQRPAGIRYSLTLHDSHNRRVIGFDNSHALSEAKRGYAARRIAWDHKHARNVVSVYDFTNPAKLLEDFWAAVLEYIEAQKR